MALVKNVKINSPGKTVQNEFDVSKGIMNLIHVSFYHDMR